MKVYLQQNVYEKAQERISLALDECERAYIAYSGGKDSTVMMHMVCQEARRRNRKVAVMFVDLEAFYTETIRHAQEMFEMYADCIEPHWICVPMKLRNALTNYEPQWIAWDENVKDTWVRPMPDNAMTIEDYPFLFGAVEFEEFITMFGDWYSQDKKTAAFIGIRAQESLHRYCAIATWEKIGLTLNGWRWTTKVCPTVWNVYPIYDWLVDDIWKFHAAFPDMPYNGIYEKMNKAGVPLSQQRLCQPFGDDQKKGLWLYHILEPQTWFKLIARVNGANSGALYIKESGNMTGANKIHLPEGHTWRSFCNLLLQTMPQKTRDHYVIRFKKFILSWNRRGYTEIPDEAPPELEAKCWAPSWRRMCKTLLRNDYWCKGLGMSQPKSEAYEKFKKIKAARKKEQKAA